MSIRIFRGHVALDVPLRVALRTEFMFVEFCAAVMAVKPAEA